MLSFESSDVRCGTRTSFREWDIPAAAWTIRNSHRNSSVALDLRDEEATFFSLLLLQKSFNNFSIHREECEGDIGSHAFTNRAIGFKFFRETSAAER